MFSKYRKQRSRGRAAKEEIYVSVIEGNRESTIGGRRSGL